MIPYPIFFTLRSVSVSQSVASITGLLVNDKLKMVRKGTNLACLCVFLEGPGKAANNLRSRCVSRDSKGEISE